MYFATIDCGTTNSRVNILNENLEIVARANQKIGVKDTAISGSREKLKTGLKNVFLKALKNGSLNLNEIQFIITSGMITSEIGLIELPHLWAPAGLGELSQSIEIVHDKKVFPLDIPVIFIRGIKNNYGQNSNYNDLRKIDFMRGEETQIIGLLDTYEIKTPLTVVVLSSHTKYINVDTDNQITGSLTTLSGQLYEAIINKTSIGKSVICSNNQKSDKFDKDIIKTAYESVMNAGFIRTILMPRFMEVLLDTTAYQRKLFIESAIAAEDLTTINDFSTANMPLNNNFVLIGQKERCKIFSYLLKKYFCIDNITQIFKETEVNNLSIAGAVKIAKKAKIFSNALENL
ncbi:MAG: 2-dehydro-3-deoxygalactonokinase [Bacillota bacterium]